MTSFLISLILKAFNHLLDLLLFKQARQSRYVFQSHRQERTLFYDHEGRETNRFGRRYQDLEVESPKRDRSCLRT
jgi:hypothetical protein